MKLLPSPGGVLSVAVVVALLSAGCNRQDVPVRYRVSGRVTFQGKPVHSGRILLVPDTAKGNSGPSAYALIQEGTFDTNRDGRGAVSGPHVMIIDGYSDETFTRVEDGVKAEIPKPLFREYKVQVDVPQLEANFEFDVPKSAAVRVRL